MNLEKLFNMQAKLDDHIKKEKGLEGQDLLDKKILALQVEIGELANEWRGFKFWSNNQEPKSSVFSNCNEEEAEYFFCGDCHREFRVEDAEIRDYECNECFNNLIGMKERNPLLEEYVDGLHFILSIGLELGIKKYKALPHKQETIVDQFIELNYQTYIVLQRNENHKGKYKGQWYMLVDLFVGLGEMLGFSWNEIEQAYISKNEINHKRQEGGY